MRKLLIALLLVVSGTAAATDYASLNQSWRAVAGSSVFGPAASPAAILALFVTAAPQYPWALCGSGAHMHVSSSGPSCAALDYTLDLESASCNAGDTLSADKLTCTVGGGTGGGTGGTGYGGDSGTGFAAWLLSWLNGFTAWILTVIASVFVGLWSMLTDLFIFVLDTLFDLVLYIVGSMSWDFTTFNPATYWNQLPADLVSVLNLIGVPIALGMIVAALAIRFVLQLIPFVRWGS